MSVTQLIYKDLLGMPPFEPLEPKGKKTKYGQDSKCWLCGGETEQLGHHVKDVITCFFLMKLLTLILRHKQPHLHIL